MYLYHVTTYHVFEILGREEIEKVVGSPGVLHITDLESGESLGVGINGLDHGYGYLPRGEIMIVNPPPTSPKVDEIGVCIYREDILDVIIGDGVAVGDEGVGKDIYQTVLVEVDIYKLQESSLDVVSCRPPG